MGREGSEPSCLASSETVIGVVLGASLDGMISVHVHCPRGHSRDTLRGHVVCLCVRDRKKKKKEREKNSLVRGPDFYTTTPMCVYHEHTHTNSL